VSGDNGFQNAPRDAARIANPYVGPRPFDEREETLFFGRTREIAALRAMITAHRIVLLYAESGAGKTSLLQAGLVPELRREGFEVLPSARAGAVTSDLCSSSQANVFVRNALVQWVPTGVSAPGPNVTIADYLATRPHRVSADGLPEPRLLLFDQFEEVFANYPGHLRDQEGFFIQVQDALRNDPLLRVLLIVREDYLASFAPQEILFDDRLRNRFRLERLGKDAALAAVTKPLAATGRSFAPGVAEELVQKLSVIRLEKEGGLEFVEGEFVEPVLLQVVCQQFWNSLSKDVAVISHTHLTAVGELHVVLARYYEEAIRRVARKTSTHEIALRRIFERYLITSTGTRGTMHVEAERTGGVRNRAIDALEAERMIRSERRAGARWIEIPHDSLVEPIRRSNARWATRRRRRLAAVGGGLALALIAAVSSVFLGHRTQQLELNSARIAWVASRLDVVTARLAVPGAPDGSYGVFDQEFGDAMPDVALGYATAAGLASQEQSAPRTTAGYREFTALRRLAETGNVAERCAAGVALVGPLCQWNWIPTWLESFAKNSEASSELRRAAVPALAARWATELSSEELRQRAVDSTQTEEVRYAAAQAYYRVLRGELEQEEFRAICSRGARTPNQIELGWAAGEYLALDYAAVAPSTLETWAKRDATAGLRKAAAMALCTRLVNTASSYRDVLPSLLALSPSDSREYREAIILAFAKLYVQESPTSILAQLKRAIARAGGLGSL